MKHKGIAGLGAFAIAFCALAPAQIRSFTLEEMVDVADDAIHGQIVASEVFRVDHPVDGPELYFTTLTIEGRSLATATQKTVQVTFHGGFLNETEGVYNSEAPSKDDILIGNEVVAFYAWTDNMGGDVAANALTAAHGGLYRTYVGGQGPTALGRGEGYAIHNNIRVAELEAGLGRLYGEKLGNGGEQEGR